MQPQLTFLRLALRSAFFYRRTHLAAAAGAAVACAVLVGALLVGDSVRYSLKRLALLRLGQISTALQSGNRFFDEALSPLLARSMPDCDVTAALRLQGSAWRSQTDSQNRQSVPRVQILGIQPDFWKQAGLPSTDMKEDEVIVNDRLARELGIAPGEQLTLSIEKPGIMPRDAPLSSRKEAIAVNAVLTLKKIVSDNEFGRFSLTADPRTPCNAFLSLPVLSGKTGLPGKVNLILAAFRDDQKPPSHPGHAEGKSTKHELPLTRSGSRRTDLSPKGRGDSDSPAFPRDAPHGRLFSPTPSPLGGEGWGEGPSAAPLADRANASLKAVWTPAHVGITVREGAAKGVLQLESERIFLDPEVGTTALSLGEPDEKPVGVLAYLVNSIRPADPGNTRSTPYSFVAACSPSADSRLSLVPPGMKDDEIIVNRWLASELDVNAGDSVVIAYYELTPQNKFVEKSRSFTVNRILDMAYMQAERDLFPRFPGLTDADSCRQWDIGMPLAEEGLNDKANEAYWKNHRSTPKALITLNAGQAMWANRFGNLSAVRYAHAPGRATAIEQELRAQIEPSQLGLYFQPVREQALLAVNQAMDFGQLFLGMSTFLLLSALILAGLLATFGVQQRTAELGTYLALGFRTAQVRRILFLESVVVALVGSAIGAPLGAFYCKALLKGLAAQWSGAVGGATVQYHAGPFSVAAGAVEAFACAVLAISFSFRRLVRRTVRELLNIDFSQDTPTDCRRGAIVLTAAMTALVLAVALVLFSSFTDVENPAPVFFGAGALLLTAGIGFLRYGLARATVGGARHLSTIRRLGMRNAARRPWRSLSVTAILACGCFMVFAVSSMKEDLARNAARRDAGTGGFELFAETTVAVPEELNSERGRKLFQLADDSRMKDVDIVSIRVREGDEASCLNLNRAQSPRLLGVNPADLSNIRAFLPEKGEDLWALLDTELPDGAVPAIAGDANTAMWNLRKKTGPDGDILWYRDEYGKPLAVKLVAKLPQRLTVFQGSVLISSAHFTEKFPSESGFSMFLIDTPPGKAGHVRNALVERMERVGMTAIPATSRLLEFYNVEATYLAMFLALGGLGLLLGTLGMGIVVLRNVLERRRELALLRCVGFSTRQVAGVVVAEHWGLAVAGLLIGAFSAGLAIWPAFRSPVVDVPIRTLAVLLIAISSIALLSVIVAARAAMRRPAISALRNE